MESVIRESDCLYTRFTGEGEHLQFAYNKLQVVAYEEEIALRGDTYTIYVNENEEDGTVVTDVFMPRAGV
jgi:effector-binding domain-containing protein